MVFHPSTSMIGNINDNDNDNYHKELPVKMENSHEEQVFLSNLAKHVNKHGNQDVGMNPQEKADNLSRLTGFGYGVGSLYLQELLGYPLVVLRRQCQVNQGGIKYHILPFGLFRVIERIHHRQGASVFWKGWGCNCLVQGMTILTEVTICELLHVPKASTNTEVFRGSNMKVIFTHELLKATSLLLTLPFFSASLVDSVQSLAMENNRSIFTFFKDATHRMIGWYMSRGHGRLLPLYNLVLPSVLYGILRYSIKSFISYFLLRINSNRYSIDDKSSKESIRKMYYTELTSNLIASLLTDILMYPLESCVLRLHLQGTRTIIDDTDNGISVVPLCTNYAGLTDCILTIKRQEGIAGFYKGFGALILQYALQTVIVKMSKPLYF